MIFDNFLIDVIQQSHDFYLDLLESISISLKLKSNFIVESDISLADFTKVVKN